MKAIFITSILMGGGFALFIEGGSFYFFKKKKEMTGTSFSSCPIIFNPLSLYYLIFF
jgi:hypothetical protein